MNNKEYLALVEKRRQERIEAGEAVEIAMPSGATWKMLPVKTAQYAVTGRLPLHMLKKLSSVRNMPEKALSPDEVETLGLAAMEFARDVMLNNLIFPKITLEETPDSITPEQIDPEDFDYFIQYLLGGAQAEANSKSRRAARK